MSNKSKKGGSGLESESPNLEVQTSKFSQSTNEVEVQVIKDFKGLVVGDVLTVSENIAEILTIKGLVK